MSTVRSVRDGRIAIITIERPERRNAVEWGRASRQDRREKGTRSQRGQQLSGRDDHRDAEDRRHCGAAEQEN